MRRPAAIVRIAFAILAIAFFATPILARLGGITAESFENRPLAEAPRLSQGWDAFGQTTRFLTDRMPLRAQAVRANTRIWTDVFGTDPPYGRGTAVASDQALPFAGAIGTPRDRHAGTGLQGAATTKAGRAGWLYIGTEFEYACDHTISNQLMLERWGRLVQAIRADGHGAMLFAVPEKASVYPEHLPDEYPFDHCALEEKERFWRLLSKAGPPLGVLELRTKLLQLKADAGDGLFQRKDLHWTTLGALTLVDAVLDAIGDGVRLESSEIVARGAIPYNGDLGLVGGRQAADTRVEYDIARSDRAPRVPGRTLLICDSFAYKWMRLFKPYFEDVRYVSLYTDEREIAAAIRRSDRVVLEAEEVNLKAHATDDETVLALIRELRAREP